LKHVQGPRWRKLVCFSFLPY